MQTLFSRNHMATKYDVQLSRCLMDRDSTFVSPSFTRHLESVHLGSNRGTNGKNLQLALPDLESPQAKKRKASVTDDDDVDSDDDDDDSDVEEVEKDVEKPAAKKKKAPQQSRALPPD